MSPEDLSVVLAHGAWADGSSWRKVIGRLKDEGGSRRDREPLRELRRLHLVCIPRHRSREG